MALMNMATSRSYAWVGVKWQMAVKLADNSNPCVCNRSLPIPMNECRVSATACENNDY